MEAAWSAGGEGGDDSEAVRRAQAGAKATLNQQGGMRLLCTMGEGVDTRPSTCVRRLGRLGDVRQSAKLWGRLEGAIGDPERRTAPPGQLGVMVASRQRGRQAKGSDCWQRGAYRREVVMCAV